MLSFSRMRAYRNGGRIVLILKINLPRLDCDGAFSEYFNSFYLSLSDSYASLVERASLSFSPDRAVKVTVSFEEIPPSELKLRRSRKKHIEDLICILRTVSVGGIKKSTVTDIFDKKRGVILG